MQATCETSTKRHVSTPQPEQEPGAREKTVHVNQADVRSTAILEPYSEFGAYTILTELGKGGMGVVYGARHRALNRRVALKVMKSGAMATFDEIERFRREAEAAAKLNHPHIVPIFEIGQHNGCAFFSMQYVEGETLSDFNKAAKDRDAEWMRKCADMIAKVARAVQHAHEHLVLHRDLKPGNILLDEKGEPHVTDFGLAKLLESGEQHTLTETILGTPEYMSPEQAWGNSRDLTTATDVFSLGAVLYHLLTGAYAFRGETPLKTIEEVRHRAPVPLRAINPRVPRDLEVICLKCLEKERAHRYSSAAALADELERWLGGRPILARPANVAERAWKWVRRNRRLTAVASAAVVIAMLGGAASTWQWRRAESQRLHSQMEEAEKFFRNDNPPPALATLARVLRNDPANRVAATRIINALSHRKYLVPATDPVGQGAKFASFTDDGRLIVGGTNEQGHVVSIHLLNQPSAISFPHGTRRPLAAALSPDGRFFATGTEATLRVWNPATGALIQELTAGKPVHFLQFVPANVPSEPSKLLVVTTDAALLYAAGSWTLLREVPAAGDAIILATLSPDHMQLAAATEAGSILLLGLPGGAGWRAITNAHHNVIRSLRFNRNGTAFVSASADGTARVWNLKTAAQRIVVSAESALLHAEFSPDDSRIVIASRDGVAQMWEARTARSIGAPMPHANAINVARFSPDGNWVLTASDDGITRLWSAADGHSVGQTIAVPHQISDASFNPDGRLIVSVAEHGVARVLSVIGGKAAQSFRTKSPLLRENVSASAGLPPIEAAAFTSRRGDEVLDVSADGKWVATASTDHSARILSRQTKRPPYEPLLHDATVNCGQFSADGTLLVTSTVGRKVRVWSNPSGQPLTDWLTCEDSVSQVSFSADNALVVTAEGEVWKIYTVAGPAPPWLPSLAEAVAGVRYVTGRIAEPVPRAALTELRSLLGNSTDTNWIAVWAKEFINDIPAQNTN